MKNYVKQKRNVNVSGQIDSPIRSALEERDVVDSVIGWGIAGSIGTALVIFTMCMVQVARSDGRVDYCRVVYYGEDNVQPPVYVVEGHRSWRPDIRIAIARSAEDAEAQRKVLCPQP